MAEETTQSATEMTQPVIVDLGKQKRSALKELKQGEGKLWDEVFEVVDEVKEMLGADAEGKILIPIVMVYQEKSSRRLDIERVIFPLMDRLEDEDDDEDDDDEV